MTPAASVPSSVLLYSSFYQIVICFDTFSVLLNPGSFVSTGDWMGNREIQRQLDHIIHEHSAFLIIFVTACLVGHLNKWIPKTQPTFLLANQGIWGACFSRLQQRKWWVVYLFISIREMMGCCDGGCKSRNKWKGWLTGEVAPAWEDLAPCSFSL